MTEIDQTRPNAVILEFLTQTMISGYNYSQNKSNPQLILELLFITGAIVIHNEKKKQHFIKLLSVSWSHICFVYNLDQGFPFYCSADLDNCAFRPGMKLSVVFCMS